MKKIIVLLIAFCLFLSSCTHPQTAGRESDELKENKTAENHSITDIGHTEDAKKIIPLPDTTMENLTDAILSVSLDEGNAYVDDNGRMQMALKIYTYDKYDMVDIAILQLGDTIVRHSGEIRITSKEQDAAGTIHINGGWENGGFDLVTNDGGIFYETEGNDVKNWYEIGEATIRVSADFRGIDNSDPEQGEVIIYPGDFLTAAVTNYDFTPYNTTVRVENGQIVEMNRISAP